MAAGEGTGQVRRHSACGAARQVPVPASCAAEPAIGKPAPAVPCDPGGPGSMAGGETLIAGRPGWPAAETGVRVPQRLTLLATRFRWRAAQPRRTG